MKKKENVPTPEEEIINQEVENSQEAEETPPVDELTEMKEKYLRLYSDFENFRKRTAKEKIELYGKIFDVDHFKLTSKDDNIPKEKRLNFDIWYDAKNKVIMKVSYSRMGNWEYRLKNYE